MPETARIKYKAGYKFQLYEDAQFETGIHVGNPVGNRYVILYATGLMLIRSGYSWDGASGPMPDSPSIMRASLTHDAIYQILREGHIPQHYRKIADKLLYRMCIQDGMPPPLAKTVYLAVRKFGASSAALGSSKPILIAP